MVAREAGLVYLHPLPSVQFSLTPCFRSRSRNFRGLVHSSIVSKNININSGFHLATNFLPLGKAVLKALHLDFLISICKVVALEQEVSADLLTSFIIPDLRKSLTDLISQVCIQALSTTVLPSL